MRLAIMQPYLFPYIGYFQLIHAVDRFVVYDDVNYIKKGWVNRNNILVNNGPFLFTVPLVGASQNHLIKDLLVSSEEPWRAKLLRTISSSYTKAPYFDRVFPLVDQALAVEGVSISVFNIGILRAVCHYIGISTTIIPSSTVYEASHLKGQERILHICAKEKADHYINPIGGVELYDRGRFADRGVQLSFLRSGLPAYQQFGGDFSPGLSIIDVLMFNAPEAVLAMMDQFELE